MLQRYNKAPMPWFGGKSQAAPTIWALLGDVMHYVEPFMGTMAVLLERPHPCNRPYHSETVADTDGLLCNAHRAIQWHPEATAEAASWPVSECVPAGTRIATPYGEVAIEHLVPGMLIWGHNGMEIVESCVLEAWHHETSRPFVQVGELVLTDNHPVWTAECGYIPARELTAFHHIATIRDEAILQHHNGARDAYAEGLPTLYSDVSQAVSSFPGAMAGPEILFAILSGTGPTIGESALSRLRHGLSSSDVGATALLQSLLVQNVSCPGSAVPGVWDTLSCAAWEQKTAMLFTGMSQSTDVADTQGETSRCGTPCTCLACCTSQIAGISPLAAQSFVDAFQSSQSTGPVSGARLWPFLPWGQSTLNHSATTARQSAWLAYRGHGTAQYPPRSCTLSQGAGDQALQILSRSCRRDVKDCGGSRWPVSWESAQSRSMPRCEIVRLGMDGFTFHQSSGLDGSRKRLGTDSRSRTVYNLHTTTGNYFADSVLVHNCDKTARQIALLKWQDEQVTDLLAGSATWCDPQMAGWWLYAVCCQIGAFDGRGPWTADPVTGRIVKVQGADAGAKRDRPDLTGNGRGVHHAGLREPGVSRDLPHLGNDGMGVHHAGLREPGVSRNLPHLSDNGRGVHHAGLREPGVKRNRPHLSHDGRGVHRPQLREPGVKRDRPQLGCGGEGVHRPQLRERGVGDDPEFHPMTMPELTRWFRWLSARLRHVRIVNGDWARVCTPGARLTLPVRQGNGYCGVFMDPPYDATTRDPGIYRQEVTHDLHKRLVDWCLKAQNDPKTRIVVAGFAGAYPELEAAGWTVHPWYAAGFLRGGYGNIDGTSQQAQERLWASPTCLSLETTAQLGLFSQVPMVGAAQDEPGDEDGAYSAG